MKQTNYNQQGSIGINGMLEMLSFLFPGNNAPGVNALLSHGLSPPYVHENANGEFLDMRGDLVLLPHRQNPVLLRRYDGKTKGIELRLPERNGKNRKREFEVYSLPEAEANSLYHECTLEYAKQLEAIE